MGAGLRHWLSQATGFKQLEPITEITAAQDLAAGEEVSLSGQVMQHLPLIEQTLYQLEDDTGAIWVLSAQSPPPVGTPLTIRAVVQYKSVLMAGQDVGEHYAEELETLLPPPPPPPPPRRTNRLYSQNVILHS